jgi:rare lipoprotein A
MKPFFQRHRCHGARHLPQLGHCTAIVALLAAALGGCGTTPKAGPAPQAPRGGGYYLDDGPGGNPPPDIDRIPDATPRAEPLKVSAMRPYTVNGKQYTPMTSLQPYRARGIASWYGRRYHGKPTSSGETYDMYAMTAAHPVLPIPSYARVTNVLNGRSVVVRINDRGPFLDGREIDLSYTAAYKLGIIVYGSGMVEVESIIPGAGAAPITASAPATAAEADGTASAGADGSQPVPVPSDMTLPVAALASGPANDAPGEARPAPTPAHSTVPPPVRPAPPPPPARAAPPPPPVRTAAAQPATVAPAIRGSSGIYVQLGAFSSRQNAENFLARLQGQVTWLAQSMHIYPRDGLYRVHAGPYASRSEARSVADRVNQMLGLKPFVLVR